MEFMKVTVNGEKRELKKEVSLFEFLKNLSLPQERIAVELNRAVVRKKDWETIQVKDADKIEIIHFVGGG
jgi:sulfur carrier protein